MKQIQTLVLMLLAVSEISLVGCSGSPSASTAAPSGSENAAAQSLIGKWGQPCVDKSSATSTVSSKNVFKFDGTNLNVIIDNFLDTACTQPSLEVMISGGYTVGPSGASASLAGATDLDGSFTTSSLMPLSAAVAGAMNASSYCGFTDWAANTPKVFPITNACLKSQTQSYTEIFEIKNGNLYLGVSGTTNARPTALDPNFLTPQ